MEFKILGDAVKEQFDKMSKGQLFTVDVKERNELCDVYLNAFPEGSDPIFKERTEHDCQCCRQFIRNIGGAVSIVEGKIVTVWDVTVGGFYQVVADAMASYVRSIPIRNILLNSEGSIGKSISHSQDDHGNVLSWNHFNAVLPIQYISNDIPSALSVTASNQSVLRRSLEEITLDSAETVLDLIEQGSLYRGEEHSAIIRTFIVLKKEFDKADNKDVFCWVTSTEMGGASKIRNTVIGSLLSDLSEGKDLEGSVKSFEAKVAPTNYKRPKSLITKAMITKAQKKVVELGFESALPRRYAVTTDLTINNVLYADRSSKKEMNVFDEMVEDASSIPKNLDKVEEIGIDDFLANVLPKCETIEALVENSHSGNMVSLIAPMNLDSKNMFKWDNNFSWAYSGDIADSMKQHVKNAGGNVTGDLRCSLAWYSRNDLDLFLIEPCGKRIDFTSMYSRNSKGRLDIDDTSGGTKDKPAVENIFWANKEDVVEGTYVVGVNNYSGSNTHEAGFDFELEFGGVIYQMAYAKEVRTGKVNDIQCVRFEYSHADGVKILESLPTSKTSKEEWGIKTEKFAKVKMIMNSPNHWDDNQTGNRHTFFMLEDCNSGDTARGFFNEFLQESLTEHRKVFEVLGSKMKAPESDEQLSGVGFSSTQRNHVFLKVTGTFTRTIKVLF